MIVIIDYGMGNIASVKNAFESLGHEAIVTREHDLIKKATKIILPGVGSFRKAMEYLKKYDLIHILREKALVQKTPILGICLGMQLLADAGEEDTDGGEYTKGLGLIPGQILSIKPLDKSYRLPHMGFNGIKIQHESPLLKGIKEDAHFYFVHSFEYFPENKSDVIASVEYGNDLVAIVGKDNVFGVQFHPEKSQFVGLKLLSNFLEF